MTKETLRTRIEAGSKKIGEKIGSMEIVSLGKVWSQRVTDDTACCYGMLPGLDYYPDINLQYAYLKEKE